MRALLYLRKSTDEHQADSIDTQRDGAVRFVRDRLGGAVVGEIVDEGESRAEFKRRPGFNRLCALATAPTREFDAIVVRDESRLGAGARLTVALDDIIAAGVSVYYYTTGDAVRLDSAEERIITAVKAAMAENERAKTAERTREALERKARSGLNVGGRVYGYDNVRTVVDGKERTEYRVNVEQAAVVLELARRYAAGESERQLARDLNARGVPSPRVRVRGTGSWSPSCIREMIRRPRYRGVLEWGHVGAAYRGGTRVTFNRKRADVVTVDRPELRIIPPELDERILERIAALTRRAAAQRAPGGRPAAYLLSGRTVSRCGICGGPMHTANSKRGKKMIRVYACLWRRDRGPAVCTNGIRRPVDEVDAVVLDWVRESILTEEVTARALVVLRRRLAKKAQAGGSELASLEAEATRLDREIKRLVALAATVDDDPGELAAQIDKRTKRRRDLRTRIEVLRAAPGQIAREVRDLEREASARLAKLRDLLTRHPAEARRFMEKALTGPITFTPTKIEGRPRFALSGAMTLGAVFQNLSDPDESRPMLLNAVAAQFQTVAMPAKLAA